jgi:hypothetical protein
VSEHSQGKCDSAYMIRYHEICDLLVRTSMVQITEFGTLDCLNGHLATVEHALSGFFPAKLCEITRLGITLRLPLQFFQALENLPKNVATTSELDPESAGLKPWLQLGSTLSQLESLTKLELWLDYDEAGSWSVVSERALLDPLLTQLHSQHSSLEISVTLPKLHPKYEQEYRHYVDGELPGNARLQRVLRQTCHTRVDAKGDAYVIEEPDFLFMFDFFWTVEEVEEMERKMWINGEDVEAFRDGIIKDFRVCELGMHV